MMGKLRALRNLQAPGRLTVTAGDIVDADHPIVRGREQHFAPLKKAPKKKPSPKKPAD
jgi:hypothetical protein